MPNYDPTVARRDVIKIYAAILTQAVEDYRHNYDRPGVMRFLNSDWGRVILDILQLDHDAVVTRLKEEVEC